MDHHSDPSVDQLIAVIQGSFLLFAAVFLVVWLLVALLACAVAPDDRAWSFFWCTLLLLGPLGVAVALLAQPRPPERPKVREGLRQGELLAD
ncbi:hypothetical protein [Mycolicibacterium sp.]|uniref:hypothetical protein n=1 Tax=Mycolicibacterium sp. TaxID=2320850 RepID=UPI0037CB2BF3